MIYIRHGNDEHPEKTYKHDPLLIDKGIKDIKRVTKLLVKKYGFPKIIYTSPFRRAVLTTEIMIKTIKKMGGKVPKLFLSNSISRYFSKREQQNPLIAPETRANKPPIYESYNSTFRERVQNHLQKMDRLYEYKRYDVWCVTHALVYKQIALTHNIPIPEHIPFLHNFILLKNKKGKFVYEMNTWTKK